MPLIDKLRFKKEEKKVKKKGEEKGTEEELHLTKEGKVKKKKEKRGKEGELHLTKEGKVKKKKEKREKHEKLHLSKEGKVKKKNERREKEDESNLTKEEKEKQKDKKRQEKEEKKKKKNEKREEEEELKLTKEKEKEKQKEKKKQEKEEKKKNKNEKKDKREEPNLTGGEKAKEKQKEKKKQEKEAKRMKKKDKELGEREEPNLTKAEKGKDTQEGKKKQKKEKKKNKNENNEKQEEPNLTREEKVKKKSENEKQEEARLTREEKVKRKNEVNGKEDEPNLTKEEKENQEEQEEEELEEMVDGITRFGEEIAETEWEGVTRFGEASPVERVTKFASEGSYMVAEKTENGMQYTDIIPTVPNHSNEEERPAEYETVRITRRRNMSVIEEEEEEGEEEVGTWEIEEDKDEDEEGKEDNGELVEMFAEALAAWVLREACQEVGRAWDEVTTAWEEMTYGELVQLRETTHRRELYKTLSMPPENELMKGSERQLSEAELRVRRSLQRLDVPEWMKNAPPPQQGFLLRRRDYGSSSAPAGGWSAYSSKTASMTSLGSSRAVTPNTPTKVVIPTRVATRGVGGIGGVTSPASNCSISPSPSDRSGSLFQYPISRWSTSRLNSGTTTPTGSVTSARTTATYTRQPYLGWRSQTSLASLAGSQSSLTSTGSYLTAADRLALGITSYSQRFVKTTPSTQDKENSSSEANAAAPKPENADQNDTGSTNGSVKLQVPADVADVHSSIKEVTSAIVHYCNESTPSPRASPRGSPRPDGRAPSPRRLVWVESSFVGSRPITSPETPTSSTHAITPTSQLNGHDLPESGEVTSRPPQPPGEYLLAW